jgi:hypothetical protein
VRHLPLVYIQERAGGPQLVGRDHEMAASGWIRIGYIYTIRITASSINLDAKYISTGSRRLKRIGDLRLVSNFYRRMRKHYRQYPKQLAFHKLHDKRCLMHAF